MLIEARGGGGGNLPGGHTVGQLLFYTGYSRAFGNGVTETRSTGKMRVRDGMILSQRTDGLSVVGLTLLEVRA